MDFTEYNLTSKEAYEYLKVRGMNCSYGWFRRKVQHNQGPNFIHLSRRRDMFREHDLIRWQESWVKNSSI